MDLFEYAESNGLPLSRVHLHPYGAFLMCYKTSIWEDAREAVVKSSIALPKYCVKNNADGSQSTSWTDQSENF